jgi:hypothetical protein
MSEAQKRFQAMITEAGGIYLECRDIEETLRSLETLQSRRTP